MKNNNRNKKRMLKYIEPDKFFRLKRWKELKKQVFTKYGYVCMRCGAQNCELHVDHIKSRILRPDLQFKFNNLQVLCKDCNIKKSWHGKKDYRPKNVSYLQDTISDHWKSL